MDLVTARLLLDRDVRLLVPDRRLEVIDQVDDADTAGGRVPSGRGEGETGER